MPRRPWRNYSTWANIPYVRKRSHKKDLVRGGADPHIRIYHNGNKAMPVEDWDIVMGLVGVRKVQMSDLCLEAIRTSINRRLQRSIGRDRFYFVVRPHPWHVYRENKMMAFAGADRLQTGMRNSFGKCVGHAARVRAGQLYIELHCNMKDFEVCKAAMHVAGTKCPTACHIVLLRAKTPEIAKQAGLPTYADAFGKYAAT
jgi:large subunit ribosomal protein L10e